MFPRNEISIIFFKSKPSVAVFRCKKCENPQHEDSHSRWRLLSRLTCAQEVTISMGYYAFCRIVQNHLIIWYDAVARSGRCAYMLGTYAGPLCEISAYLAEGTLFFSFSFHIIFFYISLSSFNSNWFSSFLTELFRGMLFKWKGANTKSHQKWDFIVNLIGWKEGHITFSGEKKLHGPSQIITNHHE